MFSQHVDRIKVEVSNDVGMIRWIENKMTFSDMCTEPTPKHIKSYTKKARHRAKLLKQEVGTFSVPTISSFVSGRSTEEFLRVWIFDTGYCVDLVRRDELSPLEAGRITAADSPHNLLTANGPTEANK